MKNPAKSRHRGEQCRGPEMGRVCVCVCARACTCSVISDCDALDCGPPGSSVHGDSPGKSTGVDHHALFQGIFLNQGLNPHRLHLLQGQAGCLPLGHLGNLDGKALGFSAGSTSLRLMWSACSRHKGRWAQAGDKSHKTEH